MSEGKELRNPWLGPRPIDVRVYEERLDLRSDEEGVRRVGDVHWPQPESIGDDREFTGLAVPHQRGEKTVNARQKSGPLNRPSFEEQLGGVGGREGHARGLQALALDGGIVEFAVEEQGPVTVMRDRRRSRRVEADDAKGDARARIDLLGDPKPRIVAHATEHGAQSSIRTGAGHRRVDEGAETGHEGLETVGFAFILPVCAERELNL